MSLEMDLMMVLQACCPEVFVGRAPATTNPPYVTWQHVGGPILRYVDGQAPDKRHPEIQVNAWAATAMQAFTLSKEIEEAICTSELFSAKAVSEPVASFDDADIASGYLQTFSILGDR